MELDERVSYYHVLKAYDKLTGRKTKTMEDLPDLADALEIFCKPASAEWVRRFYQNLSTNIIREHSDVASPNSR